MNNASVIVGLGRVEPTQAKPPWPGATQVHGETVLETGPESWDREIPGGSSAKNFRPFSPRRAELPGLGVWTGR